MFWRLLPPDARKFHEIDIAHPVVGFRRQGLIVTLASFELMVSKHCVLNTSKFSGQSDRTGRCWGLGKPMDIRTTIIDIIAEEIGANHDAIADDVFLVEELGADSPHLLEMALAIEEKFGFGIPDKDLAKLRTVGQVITYVRRKKGG